MKAVPGKHFHVWGLHIIEDVVHTSGHEKSQLDERLERNFLLAAMWKKLFWGKRCTLSELGDTIGIEYI